jgi:hypothetical protein
VNSAALPAAPAATAGNQSVNEYQTVAALAQRESDFALPATDANTAANAPVTNDDAAAKNASTSTSAPVHSDALPLVRQQLEVLSQPTVVWQGELWPGQRGEIEIRDERQGRGAADETPAFATRLTLSLPRLGEVEAVLRIQGSQLQLRLQGAAAASSEMRGALPGLDAALAALGLPSRDLAVTPHEA